MNKLRRLQRCILSTCLLWATSTMVHAFRGRVYSIDGKKIVIATKDSAQVHSGQKLFVYRNGQQVGSGLVGKTFHTSIEFTNVSGKLKLNDQVSHESSLAKKKEGLSDSEWLVATALEDTPADEALANAASAEEVKAAVAAGANVNKVKILTVGFDGTPVVDSPLWDSIEYGKVEKLKALLDANADPNIVDYDGCNSLHRADAKAIWQSHDGYRVYEQGSEEYKLIAEMKALLTAAGALPPSIACLKKRPSAEMILKKQKKGSK